MRRLLVVAVYLMMPALIALNWWLFRRFGDTDYVVWYVHNGSLISLSAAFVALVSDELQARDDLLSLHPVVYFRACVVLTAVFSWALGVHLEAARYDRSRQGDAAYMFAFSWDTLATTVMSMVVLLLVIGWVLVIAPLNYVVTLLAGAPARLQRRHPGWRPIVREEAGEVTITKEFRLPGAPGVATLSPGAKDVSLARRPVAVTQMFAALILFLANLAI